MCFLECVARFLAGLFTYVIEAMNGLRRSLEYLFGEWKRQRGCRKFVEGVRFIVPVHRSGSLGGRAPYFSRATTNSGAHSSARLISESGKVQIAFRADSA